MKKHLSREIAKFLAGVITANFCTIWWLATQRLFPVMVFGTVWTSEAVLPGLAFDFALILILIYYGWNIGKIPALRERSYLLITGAIFAVSALAHLCQIFSHQVNVVVIGWTVPLWPSWLVLLVSAYLSYVSFSLIKSPRR